MDFILPYTAIDTLSFHQSEELSDGSIELVDTSFDMLLVNVVTADFVKGFICTYASRGSRIEEINSDTLVLLKDTMNNNQQENNRVPFVHVEVQSIKTLVIKVNKQKNVPHFSIDLSFP